MKFLKKAFPGWKHFILPVSIVSAGIAISYFINQIYGKLYNGIQTYNLHEVYVAVGLFCTFAAVAVIIDAYETYELNRLFVKMRTTLIQNVYKDSSANDLTIVDCIISSEDSIINFANLGLSTMLIEIDFYGSILNTK